MALLNTSSLEDISDSRLLIPTRILFRTVGGWLDSMFTCWRVLFGFMYGICCPEFKPRVTSRKFTSFLFASIAILKSVFWNTLQI